MIRVLTLLLVLTGPMAPGAALAQPSGEGGTLRVAVSALPPSLGDPYQGNGPPGSLFWSAVFDGLTGWDAEWNLVPALATGWEMATPTRWVLTLREGVTFHNGEPFDAAAVKANFDWLLSEAGQATVIGAEISGITRVEIVDPMTVAILTETPDVILPRRLAAVMIVAPKAWAELGPAGFARAPAGTGSFRLVRFGPATADLVAFAESWRPPQMAALSFAENSDAAARLQALLAGQVDLARVAPDDLPLVEGRGFQVHVAQLPQVSSLAFRTVDNPESPLKDVRVRQALNHAVDRRTIAQALLGGLVEPASQGSAAMTAGHDPALEPYTFDPNRARALLTSAGYPDGFRMQALVVTGAAPADALVYQRVAEDLGRIGVQVELRSTVFPDLIRRYFSGEWGDLDAFGLSWNAAPYNDAIRPIIYFSCAKPNPFFCEPEVMGRIEAVQSEVDAEERLTLLRDLAGTIREQAPALFLFETADVIAYAGRLTGLETQNRVTAYHLLEWR